MIDQQRLFDALTVRLGETASRGEVLRWLGRFVLALAVFGLASVTGAVIRRRRPAMI